MRTLKNDVIIEFIVQYQFPLTSRLESKNVIASLRHNGISGKILAVKDNTTNQQGFYVYISMRGNSKKNKLDPMQDPRFKIIQTSPSATIGTPDAASTFNGKLSIALIIGSMGEPLDISTSNITVKISGSFEKNNRSVNIDNSSFEIPQPG